MNIGIIADSHDNLKKLKRIIDIFRKRKVMYLIHAGDFIAPFTIPVIKEGKFKYCYGVFGNNDGEILGLSKLFNEIGELKKSPHSIIIDNLKILILHEPLPEDIMQNLNYDIVIHGHLHELRIKEDKPIIINPGEVGGWLTGKSTAVIINTKILKPEVIKI